MNVVSTFGLAEAEMKRMHQKDSFMKKSKIGQRISLLRKWN